MDVPDVVALGEILVEIMRKKRDVPHNVVGEYLGPFPSGAPAIFTDAVARLGGSIGFIGVVGNDDFGKMLIGRLRKDGVDIKYLKILDEYTIGTAFVMYYSSGERRFIFHLRHSAAGQLSERDVDEEYIANAKILHIMGSAIAVSRSSMNAIYKAVKIAYENDVKISFDPNLRSELLSVEKIRDICKPVLEKSSFILPSRGEAEVLTGFRDPRIAGKKLLESGAEMVVIKLGSDGSIGFLDNRVIYMPAYGVEEIDPTGAGDIYDAAFIVAYLKGWSIEEMLRFANAAGAIKVTRFGPMEGPISFEEVMNFIKNFK